MLFDDLHSVDLDTVKTEMAKGDSIMIVVEKNGAVNEANEIVGTAKIVNESDFLKTKKK